MTKKLPSYLLEKKVDEITREEFDEIGQVFDKWSFRPKILFDQWVNDKEECSNTIGGA